jgi:predicted metal-dependent phosphoesterase TrpH
LIIDIHIHTKPLSADSNLAAGEAIQEAKRLGLDGICLTEHNKSWAHEDIEALRSQWNFPVFHGVEVDTVEGHVLVFGLHQDFEGIIRVDELRKAVLKEQGVMIAAHPFKGFRAFGFSELNLTPEQGSKRPVFKSVDAIEGFNGKSNEKENGLAQEVGKFLSLKLAGGSDAHNLEEVGRCVTIFENEITTERELIAELKAGRFSGDYYQRR